MAKKKQVGRRVEGWKAKSWYRVHVPDNLGKAYIGDTIANDAESVVGRIMTATLGEIVNDYSKQHVKMSFKIQNVTGDAAYTEFVGHEVTRDYLRSLVKRRSSRIDTIVPLVTKDGKKVRLTICTYTFARANLSQEHAIRNAHCSNHRCTGIRMGLNHAPERDRLGRDLPGSLQGSQDHLPHPQGRGHQVQGRAGRNPDLDCVIRLVRRTRRKRRTRRVLRLPFFDCCENQTTFPGRYPGNIFDRDQRGAVHEPWHG
jgi:small subunit ribosomal protein S3Ae